MDGPQHFSHLVDGRSGPNGSVAQSFGEILLHPNLRGPLDLVTIQRCIGTSSDRSETPYPGSHRCPTSHRELAKMEYPFKADPPWVESVTAVSTMIARGSHKPHQATPHDHGPYSLCQQPCANSTSRAAVRIQRVWLYWC